MKGLNITLVISFGFRDGIFKHGIRFSEKSSYFLATSDDVILFSYPVKMTKGLSLSLFILRSAFYKVSNIPLFRSSTCEAIEIAPQTTRFYISSFPCANLSVSSSKSSYYMLMPKTGGRLFFSCYHTQAGVRGNCAQNSFEDFNNTFNLNNNSKFWHLTSLSTRVRHLHVKQFCFSLLGWFIHVAALCLAHLWGFFFSFQDCLRTF